MKAQPVPPVPPLPHTYLHHIAVQTTDLDNCTTWYRDFLGCRRTWATDRFSDLTVSRLPGIVRMAELACGETRFHLFESTALGEGRPHPHETQFQHVCMAVDSPEALRRQREHWWELARSGRYAFSVPDPPTEIVMDDDGVESFYCLDVNGLEFEFTHLPAGAS